MISWLFATGLLLIFLLTFHSSCPSCSAHANAVLVGLYEEPEKPGNALEFFQQHLTAEGPATSDMEALKKENHDLKAKIEEVRKAGALKRPYNLLC